MNSVKRGGRCVDKLYKARSSFWARWVKHHGGQDRKYSEFQIQIEPRDEQNFSSASTTMVQSYLRHGPTQAKIAVYTA